MSEVDIDSCHFIDGERTTYDGEKFPVVDPSTGEIIAEAARGDESDVDAAVSNAKSALAEWRRTDPVERGRILSDVASVVHEHQDELARLATLQGGKPISHARDGDIEVCARYFEYYSGMADKIQGDTIPINTDYVDYTIHEPLGVTAQITPWNFPSNVLARSVAPALATGNVSVVKPPEQTPLTAIRIAELAVEAGLPHGVMNVITGYGQEAGASLVEHQDVRGVGFTGSVETGQTVASAAAADFKHVHVEAGGKNSGVVFPDVNVERVADQVIIGSFGINAGQVCSAWRRCIVHEDIHAALVDHLVDRVEDLTVGPGLEDPDVGSVVSQKHYDKVMKLISIGMQEVGEPVIGGTGRDDAGWFIQPTIFDDVPSRSQIAQREIFGPLLSVIPFSTEAEAIRLANDTDYGLVAGIFTTDNARAHRFAREVDAGQIYINEWYAGGVETPFGGFKQSGLGREKGLEALKNYTQTKNVCANIRGTVDGTAER